jgi:hypothetical protein
MPEVKAAMAADCSFSPETVKLRFTMREMRLNPLTGSM